MTRTSFLTDESLAMITGNEPPLETGDEGEDETLSDREILDKANGLARDFNEMLGFSVPEGFRFYRSENPRAQAAWAMAVLASEVLCGHEMHDALDSVLEDEAPPPELQASIDAAKSQVKADRGTLAELNRTSQASVEAQQAGEMRLKASRAELRAAQKAAKEYEEGLRR